MPLAIESQTPADVLSKPGQTITAQPKHVDLPGGPTETNTQQPDTLPTQNIANDDEAKRRIKNPPARGLFARLMRWLKNIFLTAELNAEERANLSEVEKRKLLEKELTADAKTGYDRLINCLTRLGICHISTSKDRKTIKKVRFWDIEMEPDAIWYGVDMQRLPFGVSVSQLISEETVTNLSLAVGHRVSCRWDEKSGVWYCVERASGTFGIPNHVNLSEMWDKIPASRDNLTIPIGITHNGKAVYDSLDSMIHLLVAGTTGGGKSNFLNVILCTLIRRNRPNQLQMVLVDLKNGLEFNFYGAIPHLIKVDGVAPTGIINDREGVPGLLTWLIREGERRMGVLLEAGAKNIGQYNAHRQGSNRMTQIVLVIDEWADIIMASNGKDSQDKLINIVQRMRAVGIHAIVCTQVPQSIVLSTMVKANLPGKFAFSCSSLQGSMAILNSGHAVNLQPRGRCVWQFQAEVQIQTPFITQAIIEETVQASITGSLAQAKTRHDVTPEEIREWSLRENNGYLNQALLETRYKTRGITQDELRGWLKSWEGQTYTIGSSQYIVEPGNNRRARRLVAVTDPNPNQTEQEKNNV
jgi:DNA segregation ATPase FtsK/SpoIIIE-like protein